MLVWFSDETIWTLSQGRSPSLLLRRMYGFFGKESMEDSSLKGFLWKVWAGNSKFWAWFQVKRCMVVSFSDKLQNPANIATSDSAQQGLESLCFFCVGEKTILMIHETFWDTSALRDTRNRTTESTFWSAPWINLLISPLSPLCQLQKSCAGVELAEADSNSSVDAAAKICVDVTVELLSISWHRVSLLQPWFWLSGLLLWGHTHGVGFVQSLWCTSLKLQRKLHFDKVVVDRTLKLRKVHP